MRPVLKTSLAWQRRMPRRTARSDNKDTEFTRPCLKKKSLAASLCPGAGDVEKVGGSLEFAWDKTQDFRSREHCSFKARGTRPLTTVQRQIYSQWKRATPSREGHLGLVGGPGRSPRMHFARDPPSLAWVPTVKRACRGSFMRTSHTEFIQGHGSSPPGSSQGQGIPLHAFLAAGRPQK